jgi:cyclopropane fatty-acyl-phospholipid synthase-like methyltransferase
LSNKIRINPLDVLLWNQRHSGRDIIKIYTKFSPLMQIGADTKMLNFGLWSKSSSLPDAQKEMTEYIACLGDFANAKTILDVGSGFCIPASIWKQRFPHLEICCLDLNFNQLNHQSKIGVVEPINSSSDHIPFSDGVFDRVIALESAQHFTYLKEFFAESKRVLSDDGTLVVAIPVTKDSGLLALRLGILNITWISKKYSKNHILQHAKRAGFVIERQESVGSLVYEPFADYYVQNRPVLKKKLHSLYPVSLERLIYGSMKKMRRLSEKKVIDYLLLTLKKSTGV